MIHEVDGVKERLEGISNSVGYYLEDRSYKAPPELLHPYGIEVKGRLLRRYTDGQQINIYGKGLKDGKEITIIGECKVRPSKNEVVRFLKIVAKLKEQHGLGNLFTLFVANDFHPVVEAYLKKMEVPYFWSYEF